jgi:ATP-binding cassette subfamily C protein CydC
MALLGLLPFKGAIKVTGKISGTLQEGHIFNTSLRENLLLANPGLSDYELVDVLELLELQNISLDEMLGEYGRPLSGGEGKRIGLARALLGGADVLVLDEPTEHLDHDLASRIERRVLEKYRGTTIIIITHSGWGNVGRNITIERE